MTPPVSQGCRCWGSMRGVWHQQDRRRRGPRELTGIVDHSREGSSHGPLERTWSQEGPPPCTRIGGRARRRLPRRGANRRLDPLPRTARTPLLGLLQDATSVLDAFHIVTLAGDAPGEVRRQNRQDTTGHRGRTGDPLYQIRLLLRASHTQAHPTPSRNDSVMPSWQMSAYQCGSRLPLRPASARCLPSSHIRPRPTPDHSSHREPTNVSHPRNRPTRPNPTQMEGRTRHLLRHSRSQQRTPPKPSTESSNQADAPPEATPTPPTTNSKCSSSQDA